MCIVCEIKEALEQEGPSEKGLKFINQRVEMLAAVASACHEVVCDVLEEKPNSRALLEQMRDVGNIAFNDKPGAAARRERMLTEAAEDNDEVDEVAEVLSNLFEGDANVVKLTQVEVGEGETLAEALKRTLMDNERSTKAFTKH